MITPRAILILNDEEAGLELLRYALTREFPGVAVQEHTDGEVALAALRARTVDAVITDNRMPKVTGITLSAVSARGIPRLR